MSLRADADAFLAEAHNAADGDLRKHLGYRDVGQQLEWADERAGRALQYLHDRGYINIQGIGGIFRLTVHGVDAMERVTPDLQKAQDRLAYLSCCYQETHGDPYQIIDMWEMGGRLGWGRQRIASVYEYLSASGLLQGRTLGGGISVTEMAVDQVERSERHPDSPTEYFPPRSSLNVHVQDGSVVIGPIASPGATVTHHGDVVAGDKVDIHDFEAETVIGKQEIHQTQPPQFVLVTPMWDALQQAGVPDDQLAQARVHLEVLDEQLQLPEPDESLITKATSGLKKLGGKVADALQSETVGKVVAAAASEVAKALVKASLGLPPV